MLSQYQVSTAGMSNRGKLSVSDRIHRRENLAISSDSSFREMEKGGWRLVQTLARLSNC
jgi:hypothetical protein